MADAAVWWRGELRDPQVGSVRATRTVGEFTAEAWADVSCGDETPMQQFIWCLAASRAFAADTETDLLVVGRGGRLDALAPLSRSPHWLGRLRLLGAEELGESIEVIHRDDRSLRDLAEAMANTRKPISFGHYPAASPFVAALREAYRGCGIVVSRELPDRGNPTIALDPTWIEPEKHLTPGRSSDLRRMRRAAEKMGVLSLEIVAPSKDQLSALLDEALAIEAGGWKGRAKTAVATDDSKAAFYRYYAELAQEVGILRLCFLRIDGVAVATQIAVQTNGRFWLLKIGYDERFKRCSPGNLLLRDTIAFAAAQGLRSYEFLGKEATWTKMWTTSASPLVALRVYPFNAAGGLAAAVDASRMLTRRLMGWRASMKKRASKDGDNA